MKTITGPLTRRGMLGRAAAGGALLLPSALSGAAAAAPEAAAEPIAPDGPSGPFPIPWLDANGNHNQPAGPDLEPSHVYHFKGRVARCSGFDGAGTDGAGERLLFGTKTTDYGIMDGVYWAARKPQPAALTHIWLTVFRGQFGPANQIHDFHPPITDAGLYWVVPVPAGGLTWGADGKSATLAMRDVPVIDQPTWPAIDSPATPARMTFRMTFEATDKPVTYEDKLKRFRVQGFLATCRMEAEVSVPSTGFTFRTEPIDKCPPAAFAVIGEEVNGKYYDELASK